MNKTTINSMKTNKVGKKKLIKIAALTFKRKLSEKPVRVG